MSRDEIKRMIASSLSLESRTYKNCFGETIVELALKMDDDVINYVDITVDKGD